MSINEERIEIARRVTEFRTRLSRVCQELRARARSSAVLLWQRLIPRLVTWSELIDAALEPSLTPLPYSDEDRRREIRRHVRQLQQRPGRPQNDRERWLQQVCDDAAPKAEVPAPRVFIGHDAGATWAARFHSRPWEIEFNGAYLADYDESAIRWIMLHELAHAWVHFNSLNERQDDPHGQIFQNRARELGVS